jgi:hypothetical protein
MNVEGKRRERRVVGPCVTEGENERVARRYPCFQVFGRAGDVEALDAYKGAAGEALQERYVCHFGKGDVPVAGAAGRESVDEFGCVDPNATELEDGFDGAGDVAPGVDEWKGPDSDGLATEPLGLNRGSGAAQCPVDIAVDDVRR